MKHIFFIFLFLLGFPTWAGESGRYFFEGDGRVKITNAKTGANTVLQYRSSDGSYPTSGLKDINRVFGVPANSHESMSLRFIALLDHLEDHFKSGPIRIVSGYRSPSYNEGLRRKGKLAAKTSMHIEGMAADIEMGGVDAKKIWEYVRSLDCCGAGYYHGRGVHLDTGPSRFWDETSTKVEQDLGGHNKLVLLRTNFDKYWPGETMHLTLGRITDYPIGIRPTAHLRKDDKKWQEIPLVVSDRNCVMLNDSRQARSLSWVIPSDFSSDEKVAIEITFCEKSFPEMPDHTTSNIFAISGSK